MKIIEQPQLADYSSIHIGGLGNFLYMPQTLTELESALTTAMNPIIVGGGTNVVFADSFQGDVVSLQTFAADSIAVEGLSVSAQAGVKLAKLVYTLSREGIGGIEVLAGIPGTLGGAVVMNAGSRYGCIGDFVRSIRVLHEGNVRIMKAAELDFSYRHSCLQDDPSRVVLGVELEFERKVSAAALTARISEIIRERITSRISQPNCGSVFRNPRHELTAGAMIDRLGMKGRAAGGIAVSELHGNIFVNRGDGVYKDFMDLSALVQERVMAEFGVDLELEIRVFK